LNLSKDIDRLAEIIPQRYRVAFLATNSLRSILDLFGKDNGEFPYGITKLEARASKQEEKQ
jgi:hypothetical protein